MLARFQAFIGKHSLVKPRQPVLLAVSGGLDSMVMTDLFKRAGFKYAIAHANFQLRGEDSEADEQLVAGLAEEHGVPLHSERFKTKKKAEKLGISIQMAARVLRYEWFNALCKQHGYVSIATAHHAGDQAETMLLHLAKGTGIRGIAGMQPKVGNRIKPLLFATRDELETYAKENRIDYQEDKSNLSEQYERNYIRLQVIPSLQQINPNLVKTLSESANHLRFAERIFNERVEYYRKKLLVPVGKDYHIPIRLLHTYPDPPRLLFELVHDLGFEFAQIEQALVLPLDSSGQEFRAKEYRIIKNRHHLILTTQRSETSGYIPIHEGERHIELETGRLHIEPIEHPANVRFPKDEKIATLDAGKLEFPLTLRKWRQGDYLYPIGLTKPKSNKVGKKKVSDLFTNLKLSKVEKEKAWVLCSGKKIVWVMGYRLDDRFKVTPHTKKVLRFRYETVLAKKRAGF